MAAGHGVGGAILVSVLCSEGALGRRRIAVLSSEVTLPVVIQQMFVWSRLSARDAGGTETKKEPGFALEELPDRQWRQTHRIEGSWRCRFRLVQVGAHSSQS